MQSAAEEGGTVLVVNGRFARYYAARGSRIVEAPKEEVLSARSVVAWRHFRWADTRERI